MDIPFYLHEFRSAYDRMEKHLLEEQGVKIFIGVVLDSVVIKAYKPEWSNDPGHPVTAVSRIFFSVWVCEKALEEKRLYYNIHAFKLRQLPGHKITSRDFAERFRQQFNSQASHWPNCSVKYGPLTLMEGWVGLDPDTLSDDVAGLVRNFYTISPLIDSTLKVYRV